ncbi:glutathione S-transferase [Sphingomonas spermidinifaciens]|uniref:Glutathione S-transferase n=1 Tax=Sphingomonas spermidinifaciens TaxID=1141889 RepID=A0A2A4BA57_9SPHN|nr:glutathione S-transferase family protein [Sphingomonas spermidinifaciens]PCD04556.1 glutathione S-transferase [Sphingomonas spermidinifaciens]
MPKVASAPLTITAFDWVPDFARGFVRDLRPRWACEEIGMNYAVRLVSAVAKPDWYFLEQPWGQVPVIEEDGRTLFESGAILLHLGEKDERLLPRDPAGRDRALAWLFAAYNSIEPWRFEHARVTIFAAQEEWAKLRRPSLEREIGQRLDRLAAALGEREWLAGRFGIADIAMVTVLREMQGTALLADRPVLAGYVARGMARPAFQAALAAQLADFNDERAPKAA